MLALLLAVIFLEYESGLSARLAVLSGPLVIT